MRKVLSFVLVLTLVLSSFSMAFAADTTATAASLTDVAGNANEDAIQVNFDLGIVTGNPDGTFLPAKAVTRAEFAAMLTRALDIPASALAGYTATSFKDTAGYTWAVPYLAFCQSKGILLGDGAGNVMPGKTITVNEAMTMSLRAIGYTANSSLLVGAWPANYVSIAQNESLYDDVATTTTVDKASAAQIIYNLLTVQKVAVNSDGTTDYMWKNAAKTVIANLLNTNLGCTEDEDVVLGSAYDYDNALINITDSIGAYGTAYLNDDGDLVAFTKDSTALTGKLNSKMDTFEVGDVDYDIANASNTFTTNAAFFANTVDTISAAKITVAGISQWAFANADGGKTVTLNVDLSGKKIKDIYSVVAWKADDTDLAESDVQEDIADKKLLGNDFVDNDDKVIDMNSFELVGVASLDKIAKDNVVYVYTDGSDIRKVAVGTQTVTGTIDEINDDKDQLTVGGKDYDVSSVTGADTFSDTDVDADGIFYLDAFGEVYSFDGTAKADNYGVVKASEPQGNFDALKIKLYTSDDATKTLYLAEDDPYDIDWTSTTATAVTATAVSTGALIGYSLDSAGNIDAINNTVKTTNATTFKYKGNGVIAGFNVADNAVGFTYKTSIGAAYTSDYDVIKIADIDADTALANATYAAYYILNDDGDIAALFVEESLADVSEDAVYGVINKRATATTDGDDVYKFTGFIDGTAFTYKTDDQVNTGVTNTTLGVSHTAYQNFAGKFGVYAITLDASNTITKIDYMQSYLKSSRSGYTNGTGTEEIVTDLASSNTKITTASGTWPVADKAVVYKYDVEDDEFTVSKLSAIDKTDSVMLYDTEGSDADGIADVVIFHEN